MVFGWSLVSGFGFGVWGFKFRVSGFGFRSWGLELMGFRGFRVWH